MSLGTYIAGWKRWLAVGALLGACCAAGRAKAVDPQMGMVAEGDPLAFTSGVTFAPDVPQGGGVFQYYNATGATILDLTFVATNIVLDADQLSSLHCNNSTDSTAPNPFFLYCGIDYTTSKDLEFVFYGTNPGIGGLDEGIPPLAAFDITLNFNYSLNGDSGGWGSIGYPSFKAALVQTDFSSAPEPAPVLLITAAVFAVAAATVRKRRRRAAPRCF